MRSVAAAVWECRLHRRRRSRRCVRFAAKRRRACEGHLDAPATVMPRLCRRTILYGVVIGEGSMRNVDPTRLRRPDETRASTSVGPARGHGANHKDVETAPGAG